MQGCLFIKWLLIPPRLLKYMPLPTMASISRQTALSHGLKLWEAPFSGDIALMPGNPATVYAATDKGAFYLSTDSGITYSQITNGLPSGNGVGKIGNRRYACQQQLCICPCSPSSANDYGFYGLYLSTNGGTAFPPSPPLLIFSIVPTMATATGDRAGMTSL